MLANAVLLHFTREQTQQVLHKVYGALKAGGRFAFTLKQGDGEGWSKAKLGAPRYFSYWTESGIRERLERTGFHSIDIKSDQATYNAAWLQVIAKK